MAYSENLGALHVNACSCSPCRGMNPLDILQGWWWHMVAWVDDQVEHCNTCGVVAKNKCQEASSQLALLIVSGQHPHDS